MTDNYESAGCLIDKRNITHPPRKKKKSSASRGCHVVIVCSAVNAVQCSAVHLFLFFILESLVFWNHYHRRCARHHGAIDHDGVCMYGWM